MATRRGAIPEPTHAHGDPARAPDSFRALGLSTPLLEAVSACGYAEPTPIQRNAVPPALAGRDVLGGAPTGTGKTAAFIWPLLSWLAEKADGATPRALILAPTRELAAQNFEALERYRGALHLRAALCVGGASADYETRILKAGVDAIVATPGRLIDHVTHGRVALDSVGFVVLDEADRMAAVGFEDASRRLLRACAQPRQTLFFSATLGPSVIAWAHDVLTSPVRVEAEPMGTLAPGIVERMIRVRPRAKPSLLAHLLLADPKRVALAFVNTRRRARQLAEALRQRGVAALELHGEMPQGERTAALNRLRKGAIRCLTATDMAARGLDIPLVGCVYNVELGRESIDYIHRVGRTARAGGKGMTVSFVSDEEVPLLREIVALTGREVLSMEIGDFDFQANYAPLPEPPALRKKNAAARRNKARQTTRAGKYFSRKLGTGETSPQKARSRPKKKSGL